MADRGRTPEGRVIEPWRWSVADPRGGSATMNLRHGSASYGRQQWGILNMMKQCRMEMDPSKTFLGRTLLEEITPMIMVLRTSLVEEACQKNGLSFIQMLQPFCLFNRIDVPVRTASDQPYRLQMFKLRLAYASEICQPNVEVAEEHLKQVVSRANEEPLTELSSDAPELEIILKMAESRSFPSWFQIFNKELIHTISFSEHETFDHPIACLLVVSSKDVQPLNKFVDLFNTNQLPSLLNDGAMDPKVLKHYLLVHDNQDGPSEKANDMLIEMRNTFGSSDCKLLCINSAESGIKERESNPWLPYIADADPNVGRFLDTNDLNEIKDLMQDLASKHIIPYMEQKVRVLNQQVSATRKGFRNQIKNLWWRKGKEDTPDAPNGPMYTFSSIESQIRVLGDYAFMLRDYELALSNYRLLSTDYKLDKAWKRYAGVQEMTALCYFMLDQSRKEAEYSMENAFSTYLRIGSSGQRNATRCGLWWVEMLKAWGQFKEAAGVYFRISSEERPLHAAVMLEQSSYCYLYASPPMLRKYGFHLVLAGSRYEITEQRMHAIRTYRSALSVYKGSSWNYINDHVHFNIGKWFSLVGLFEVAMQHMLEILACSHQPLSTQELFLRNFLHVVQNLGKNHVVFRLQLPVIGTRSISVIFEDHRTYASSTSVHVKESLWRSLEDEMVPSISTTRTNWLDSQTRSSLKKFKDFSICVAGEAIKVNIEMRNPLQTPISISGVSLVCELSPRSEEAGSDEHKLESSSNNIMQLNDRENKGADISGSSFVLSEMNFTLQGGETRVVELIVTPKVEGILKIIGARWTLAGCIIGYCNFDTDIPKKKPVKRRKSKPSSRQNLKFLVIKALPKLDGCIHQLPMKPYAGDLRRLVLELRNPSESPIKNLKMKVSHPAILIPGSLEDMDVDFPSCLEKQSSHEHIGVRTTDVKRSGGRLVLFSESTVIQGGSTFSWPLWMHTGVPGRISLFISIYYEVENSSSEMNYRILRMVYELEVLPSLEASFHISPCQSRLQEFLVRMDITNRTTSQSFSLRQLSAVGQHWKISLLPPDLSVCTSKLLLAGQALSCFFKLTDSRKFSSSEGIETSTDDLLESDVNLGSQENREPLLDLSTSPLIDFHYRERLQVKTDKDHNRTVDFILISELLEKRSSDPRDASDAKRLYSHHACQCSIANTSPIWWQVDGPRILHHNFFSSFCEVKLYLTIRNCSDMVATIKINNTDAWPDNFGQALNDSSSSGVNRSVGWHDISLENDLKTVSDSQVTRPDRTPPPFPDTVSPFIWCASSSTKLTLGPSSSIKIPLQITAFSAGTYDLSSYNLSWSLQLPEDQVSAENSVWQSSGTCKGHPFYLTVLQSH
ncbi:hypothetical protein H6P81_014640 [Aristolochia fimbriata]|uniref:Trafficking protein particle complex subunit 8 n=1 Tax=Aristolochia fimbriata TaxID=158543 RepID=A0AAV7E311_ARIFI|nr:hypothetical protein H6P81_014640 [Aristolochia fimbriata]